MPEAVALSVAELEQAARRLRRRTLEMIVGAGKGHLGGSFSCMEILVALYYGRILRVRPGSPDWPDRDRLILSKGHGVLGIYPLLADLGFFAATNVQTFAGDGSVLSGHPDMRVRGVETVSGSLGHGLSIGAGIALGARLDGADFRTFVLLGDGECHEGSVWEAALFAAQHRLHTLTAIVDWNGVCATDFLDRCLTLDPVEDKWRAFGWDIMSVDGHSLGELLPALRQARDREGGRPLAIIARTIKGRGVSFMENSPHWHHSVPRGEELERARRELA